MTATGPDLRVFSHEAMATSFEVRLVHEDTGYAGQAAQACFAEVDRLERLLSRFEPGSEVARIAQLEPGETLSVSADTFDCLRLALEMHELTGGAFDPTLGSALDRFCGDGPTVGSVEPSAEGRAGPLVRAASSDVDGVHQRCSPTGDQEGARARACLLLDSASLAVRVIGGPIALDLGAIGKGYALDAMARLLVDWEIERALLIAGGGSSVLALDNPVPDAAWKVGVGETTSTHWLALARRAVGSSGFSVQGAHIIDPRTREPARRHLRTWALAPTAAEADALSTAWMCLALDEIAAICEKRTDIGAIVLPTRGALFFTAGSVASLSLHGSDLSSISV
jgi:FAD:protein FMN transferase